MGQHKYTVEINGHSYDVESDQELSDEQAYGYAKQEADTPVKGEKPLDAPGSYANVEQAQSRGFKEGAIGGAKGFVEGLKNSPMSMAEGIVNMLTTDPRETIKKTYEGIKSIPGVISHAGADPRGFGEAVGNQTGQMMIGAAAPALVKPMARVAGKAATAVGSHPFAFQIAGAHQILGGSPVAGTAAILAPDILKTVGGALEKFGAKPAAAVPFNELPLAEQMKSLPNSGGIVERGRNAGPVSSPGGRFNDLPLAQQMDSLPATGNMVERGRQATPITGGTPLTNDLPLWKLQEMMDASGPTAGTGTVRTGGAPFKATGMESTEAAATNAAGFTPDELASLKKQGFSPEVIAKMQASGEITAGAGKASSEGTISNAAPPASPLPEPVPFDDILHAKELIKKGYNPYTAAKIIVGTNPKAQSSLLRQVLDPMVYQLLQQGK